MISFRRCPHLISTLGLLCLISACATVSKNDCANGEWELLGEKDGAKGHGAERVEDYKTTCAEFGIQPDSALYERGRLAGLDRFCTVSGGLTHGRSGRTYNNVCSVDSEDDFLRAYDIGLELHDIDGQLGDIRQQIQRLESDYRSDNITDQQRRNIQYQVQDLQRQYQWKQQELSRLEDSARRLRQR